MTNTPEADLVAELPEWHRSDNEYSILLYTLKQDGWRKGEPVMVNDLMIRIENAPGSNHDLGPIADKLLAALTPASAEPVAVPDGNPDLNLAAWMDVRRSQLGPWADYLIREVGKLEGEIARMRDHHPAPVAVEAADHLSIAKERADWLLDAVACATQDRRFLRGEPEYDEVVGEAILLNAEKAILTALRALQRKEGNE